MQPSDNTLNRLIALVGEHNATRDKAQMAGYLTEWRGLYQGQTPLLVRPKTAEELSEIMRICAETKTPIVPQSGNTGLVGGQIPTGPEVLINLERMSQIRDCDPSANTITVEAGCILKDVQDKAREAGRFYPLSLAAEGSARIGGLLSTNAGGVNVLRYGNAGEHVLGLEVVLADGQIWKGLRALRKDNTGYNLKSLFLGAEGTLGIITAATLKLWPYPNARATAFVGLSSPQSAIDLLHELQNITGGLISGFELIARTGLEFVTKHISQARDPLASPHPWYVLIEATAGRGDGLKETFVAGLEQALDNGQINDAALAESETQADDFWRLRESLSEVQKFEGGSIKHDISVPVGAVPAFLTEALNAVESACPGVRPCPFGHAGDGNLHFNLSQPLSASTDEFMLLRSTLHKIVYDITAKYNGSISAEHGIGIMKVGELERTKGTIEMNLMKTLKRALDPDNLLNPGKVLKI